MNLPKKTGDFFDTKSGVVPPGPGQTAHYVCHACGEHFTHTIPFIFDFMVRCPKCLSFRVGRDPTIVY